MTQDWKEKLGAAFNRPVPTEEIHDEAPEQPAADAVTQQGGERVSVLLDRKGRHGKQATLVTGLRCDPETLKQLAAQLKRQCGVGGSARGGEILIQGDLRQKVADLLRNQGFKVTSV